MRPNWRIYYADGSTFDSTQGWPSDAPREGFIGAIGYAEDKTRYIMSKWDFYRYDHGAKQFWGCDIWGLQDFARVSGYAKFHRAGVPSTFVLANGKEVDQLGLVESMKKDGLIFEGRTVTRTEWGELMGAAHRDPDFPIAR